MSVDRLPQGGNAFPLVHGTAGMSADGAHNDVHLGMTLRDWFAGQALADLASWELPTNQIAAECYLLADAMLKERSKS